MERHLWLIGMMGSGKSTVGARLARRLDRPFVDVDDHIAQRMGCTIAQLWGERGEAAFRGLEAAAIARLAEDTPSVYATGGGVVLDAANVATMRASGAVVWLTARTETLAKRVGNASGRPLLLDADATARLAAILEARRHLYEAASHVRVPTDGLSRDEVTARIEAWWNES